MEHIDYLKIAYQTALDFSTDKSTQNGAVLVSSEGEFMCAAANHFPRGVQESEERWQRPLKYKYVEHAERNVIYAAARLGLKTENATMYCPFFACADCGRAIIQAGISRVIGHVVLDDAATHEAWLETIEIALQMLDESGVKYEYVEEKLGGIDILRNGVIINP